VLGWNGMSLGLVVLGLGFVGFGFGLCFGFGLVGLDYVMLC
jgi:hypothetical protein